MNQADWMTAVGRMAGVLGIGLGLWWADAAVALFISASVLHDGIRNTRVAVGALMDTRTRTVDGTGQHPFVREVSDHLRALPWAAQVGCRVRDLGHVFDVQA